MADGLQDKDHRRSASRTQRSSHGEAPRINHALQKVKVNHKPDAQVNTPFAMVCTTIASTMRLLPPDAAHSFLSGLIIPTNMP